MTKEQFLDGLNEDLEFDSPLAIDSNIKEHDEWDSMGAMILIGYVSNKFGITINADDIRDLTTVQSLIEKIGVEKFN